AQARLAEAPAAPAPPVDWRGVPYPAPAAPQSDEAPAPAPAPAPEEVLPTPEPPTVPPAPHDPAVGRAGPRGPGWIEYQGADGRWYDGVRPVEELIQVPAPTLEPNVRAEPAPQEVVE